MYQSFVTPIGAPPSDGCGVIVGTPINQRAINQTWLRRARDISSHVIRRDGTARERRVCSSDVSLPAGGSLFYSWTKESRVSRNPATHASWQCYDDTLSPISELVLVFDLTIASDRVIFRVGGTIYERKAEFVGRKCYEHLNMTHSFRKKYRKNIKLLSIIAFDKINFKRMHIYTNISHLC